jgi:hypothetical protein
MPAMSLSPAVLRTYAMHNTAGLGVHAGRVALCTSASPGSLRQARFASHRVAIAAEPSLFNAKSRADHIPNGPAECRSEAKADSNATGPGSLGRARTFLPPILAAGSEAIATAPFRRSVVEEPIGATAPPHEARSTGTCVF